MTAAEIIPPFVFRGISTWDSEGCINYRSEADLRDALAAAWWFRGAEVHTEVKVPSCGRIDVLVGLPTSEIIIEVKQSIMSATEARQAFQQVHAYAAYRRGAHLGPDSKTPCVTAAEYSPIAAQAAARAYPDTVGIHFMGAINLPSRYRGNDVTSDHLVAVASRRRSEIEKLLSFASAGQLARTLLSERVSDLLLLAAS